MKRTYLALRIAAAGMLLLTFVTFFVMPNMIDESMYYGGVDPIQIAIPSLVWPIVGFAQLTIFGLAFLALFIIKKVMKNEEDSYRPSVITMVVAFLLFAAVAVPLIVDVFSAP